MTARRRATFLDAPRIDYARETLPAAPVVAAAGAVVVLLAIAAALVVGVVIL